MLLKEGNIFDAQARVSAVKKDNGGSSDILDLYAWNLNEKIGHEWQKSAQKLVNEVQNSGRFKYLLPKCSFVFPPILEADTLRMQILLPEKMSTEYVMNTLSMAFWREHREMTFCFLARSSFYSEQYYQKCCNLNGNDGSSPKHCMEKGLSNMKFPNLNFK